MSPREEREDLEERAARLSGPAVPAKLEEVLEGLPRKPRYTGPEAWLAALSALEGAGGPGDAPSMETARPMQGRGNDKAGSKEKAWSS